MRTNAVQTRRKKIEKISVSDQVFNSIKQDIIEGVWKAGEKLPAEAELANQFGVNRLSVRIALQKLGTLGMIETKVGEGSYVVESYSLKPIFREIAALYDGDEKYEDVRQLRYLMEGECMKLAFFTATEKDMESLKTALDKYDEISRLYYDNIENQELLYQLVDADFNFHYQIIKMSHNSLYKDIYYMIQQLIHGHIMQLLSKRIHNRKKNGLPYLSANNDSHHKIYQAILSHDQSALENAEREMYGMSPIEGMDIFTDSTVEEANADEGGSGKG